MKLSEQQALFAIDVSRLIKYIFSEGYTCTLGEVYRTKEQAEIYAKQGIGSTRSLHMSRLAIDLNLFKDGEYLTKTKDHKQFGDYWEKLNKQNKWGGRFNDGGHYQRDLI